MKSLASRDRYREAAFEFGKSSSTRVLSVTATPAVSSVDEEEPRFSQGPAFSQAPVSFHGFDDSSAQLWDDDSCLFSKVPFSIILGLNNIESPAPVVNRRDSFNSSCQPSSFHGRQWRMRLNSRLVPVGCGTYLGAE